MYRKRKTILCILVAALLCFALCGSMFKPAEMTLGVDKNIVYRNELLETFLVKSKANADYAVKQYQGSYCVFLSVIRSKSDDNKNAYLGSLTSNTNDMLYSVVSNSGVKEELAGLGVGNIVKAYGKMSFGLGKWTLTIDKIEKSSDMTMSSTAYSTKNGVTLDQGKMVERRLNGGKVKFWIPADWEGVERDLIETKLGTMEGYQYCLNEIQNQSVQPESLFICYFNNEKQLLRSGDKKETERIERAIVKNILKSDPGSASLKKKTYYGAEYHYYQSAYKTALGQNYHAEFVFQPVGTEGFVVYLYVYRDKAHLDECMITMRLLEAD